MMFRKRPEVIEAWHNVAGEPIPDWVFSRGAGRVGAPFTLIGQDGVAVTIEPGDWVVRGSKDDAVYPLTDAYFQATYEWLEGE